MELVTGKTFQHCTRMNFPLRISADLVTSTEEILNGKLHFLCCARCEVYAVINFLIRTLFRMHSFGSIHHVFHKVNDVVLEYRPVCVCLWTTFAIQKKGNTLLKGINCKFQVNIKIIEIWKTKSMFFFL